MCLETAPVALRAEEDIICYKRFEKNSRGQLKTPYRSFLWPNKAESIVRVPSFGCTITSHGNLNISQGIHAYTTEQKAEWHKSLYTPEYIRTMIIPQGTLYILDEQKECIVALAMRLAKSEVVRKKKVVVKKKVVKRKKK